MSQPPEIPEWYYSTDGQSSGPVSIGELRQLIGDGRVQAHHFVRHRGWDTWWSVTDAAATLGLESVPSPPTPDPPPSVGASGSEPAPDRSASTTDDARNIATFQQRITSWAIDAAVLVIALVVFNNVFDSTPAWSTLFVVAFYVAYTFGLGYRGYDTVGHLALGLSVRDRETGDRVGPVALASRSSLVALLAVPFLLGLIGSAVGAWAHPKSLAWHDVATNTTVMRVRT